LLLQPAAAIEAHGDMAKIVVERQSHAAGETLYRFHLNEPDGRRGRRRLGGASASTPSSWWVDADHGATENCPSDAARATDPSWPPRGPAPNRAGDGRVLKFTAEGKQLQEIVLHDAPVGKDCGFPSAAVNNFIDAGGTTDILFLPGGRLFLTDGYGKRRVLEYAGDGRRVRAWGGRGDGPGQFRVPE
jgi:hypothetical protein